MLLRCLLAALVFALVAASTTPLAHAAECPDRSEYAPAREIIAELHRIVSPDGVQESYAATIGASSSG